MLMKRTSLQTTLYVEKKHMDFPTDPVIQLQMEDSIFPPTNKKGDNSLQQVNNNHHC